MENKYEIKKDKLGRFVKGNMSMTKEARELARQAKVEKIRKKEEERRALVKRVRLIRGENCTLDDIEKELAQSDGLMAIKRVEDLYKRLMYESLLLEDIDWNNRAERQKRKDILSNLKALATLIKEFANIQQLAKIWEDIRRTPKKTQEKFDNGVIDFAVRAAEKVAKIEKQMGK